MAVELCFYCGKQIFQGAPYQTKRTKDHKSPRARGGSNRAKNIVLACQPCNVDKGKMTLEEYRLVIAYRRGQVERATFKFFGEGGKFAAERSGVQKVVWEPKFFTLSEGSWRKQLKRFVASRLRRLRTARRARFIR